MWPVAQVSVQCICTYTYIRMYVRMCISAVNDSSFVHTYVHVYFCVYIHMYHVCIITLTCHNDGYGDTPSPMHR